MVEVSQQSEGWSCGLFCIEFCRVLAQFGADKTRSKLFEVSTTHTRTWLGHLNRTLGIAAVPPQDGETSGAESSEEGPREAEVEVED